MGACGVREDNRTPGCLVERMVLNDGKLGNLLIEVLRRSCVVVVVVVGEIFLGWSFMLIKQFGVIRVGDKIVVEVKGTKTFMMLLWTILS